MKWLYIRGRKMILSVFHLTVHNRILNKVESTDIDKLKSEGCLGKILCPVLSYTVDWIFNDSSSKILYCSILLSVFE